MNTTPILRATNIVKKLGGKTILNDVSLDVHKGDVKVVIGPSGAGKSTFLQCLNYLLPPDSGDIWLEGKKVNARDTRELCALRQQVGMIFQDCGGTLNPIRRIGSQFVEYIRIHTDISKQEAWDKARSMLEKMRLPDSENIMKTPARLTGKEKNRCWAG